MRRIVLFVLILIILFGSTAVLGWWFYRSRFFTKNSNDAPYPTPEWYVTDKDGDTISDAEEQQLGTNQNDSDTDGDGIADYLEMQQYKTDPKNPDTDGDGYRDGVEILKGFNPLEKAPTNQ